MNKIERMNKLLIITGLIILYYILLFYLDNKRRKAFKLAQQKVIGQTSKLPIIEPEIPIDLFGTTKLDTVNTPTPEGPNKEGLSSSDKLVVEVFSLEQELEELAIDLAAEQTFETSKDNLIGELAASTKDIIEEEDLSTIIAKISTSKS